MDESVGEEGPSSTVAKPLGAEEEWGGGRQCRPPVRIGNLTPSPGHSNVYSQVELDGVIYMSTANLSLPVAVYALWKLEDVSGGHGPADWRTTRLLGDVYSPPLSLTVMGGKVFFVYNDGVRGSELWKTDGTPGGTVPVKDINPFGEAFPEFPQAMVAVGRTLYFSANDGTRGEELWRSDGTTNGTRLVKDIAPGAGGSAPGPFFVDGQRLLFAADDGVQGRELWKSDGTTGGTRLVKDIAQGAAGSSPDSLFRLDDDEILFVADDGVHGRELWKTDGTRADTELVEDIRPGSEGSGIQSMTLARRTVFFTADDGAHGRELWATKGCEDDTRLVKDLRPGVVGSMPRNLAALGGSVVMAADDGTYGREPWKSDGTAGGTVLLADTYPAPGSPPPGYEVNGMVTAGSKVFFYAVTPTTGLEPWVTNGTPSGTHLVKDIFPGPANSISGDSDPFFPVGGGVLFRAYVDTLGFEPWWSEGTAAGTKMADISPGPGSSSPGAYISTRDWVVFIADDGTGSEPWALPTACFPKE
ncbi:ELWxxDGT repeat protein [Pyxidicoccus trucidator]|uniref:ELWxxDGT repeat protein n=1 Tax=Pyxidicoccus trucidator TaxID=2709662 RepID=UPI0013D9AF01|nr:ELWxxDGT repeat protein [Pyxidicoccus trucidator]